MNFKKLLPHGIAVLTMVVVALMFFSDYVFDGKVLSQSDIIQASASQSEMEKFKAQTGTAPLWTGAYFSGMPTYQIHIDTKGNLTLPIFRAMLLWQPLTSPFAETLLAMLCMYLLFNVLRVDWRLGLLGSIVFGISTFNMDIIAAGHSTKMVALALTPGVLAGAILTFRGQWLTGGALFALFTSLQMCANHYQVTYYTFLIVAILGITELISAIKGGTIVDFGKSAVSLIVGLGLGILCNLTTIWTTLEYQGESTRGKTELSAAKKTEIQTKQGQSPSSAAAGGLTKDYAFGWSYGIGESMTLLVQNAYGGGASQDMRDIDLVKQGMSAAAFYKGDQPFVGVAIYYGAIVFFLFILGLQLADTRWRWAILAATILMIGIAWGKNSPIANVLYDFMPMFNKFRAHTQALGLGQMLFAMMAMLGIAKFLDPSVSNAQKQRALYIAGGVSVLLCLVAMFGSPVSETADNKITQQIASQIKSQNPNATPAQIKQQADNFLSQIRPVRSELASSDATRSLMLIAIAFGILFATLKGWLSKPWMTVGAIALLIFGDAWSSSRRIIYDEKFQNPAAAQEEAQPKQVDQLILKDKDLSFRVLDLRGGSPFENANTSMYHKSVGGYHAAKMMGYQEMREMYLENFEPNTPIFQQKNMPLYGMLNAKYIVMGDGMDGLQPNPMALGNAWFVKTLKVVENADAEIEAVGTINPRYEAVMQKKHADKLGGFTPQYDSTGSITLKTYHPDKMEYESISTGDQLAVFSEIYYPMEKGWNITIDGKPAEFVKANYILRAAKIPSGSHKIVMEFKPASYYSGETYSMIASALLLLSLIGGLYLYFKKNDLPDADRLAENAVPIEERKITERRAATPKESGDVNRPEPPKPSAKKKK
jgi:hypothetical protein